MGFNALIFLKTDITDSVIYFFQTISLLIMNIFLQWDNIIIFNMPDMNIEFSMLDLFIAITIVGVVIGMFMVFPKRDHFEKL